MSTAEALIERGANINLTNNDGDSALLLAAEKGYTFLFSTAILNIRDFDQCRSRT